MRTGKTRRSIREGEKVAPSKEILYLKPVADTRVEGNFDALTMADRAYEDFLWIKRPATYFKQFDPFDLYDNETVQNAKALVVDLPNNLGIGGAVQTGFKYAARNNYRFAIQFDGDGQHLAGEIPKLLANLNQQNVNMVIGSRFMEKHAGYRSTFMRRLGIRLFEGLNSVLIGQRITDNTSGFRAYDRKAIEFLALYYPVDYPEPEALALLRRQGYDFREVASEFCGRTAGRSSIQGWGTIYYVLKVFLALLVDRARPVDLRYAAHNIKGRAENESA